jgi:hypothetical protein
LAQINADHEYTLEEEESMNEGVRGFSDRLRSGIFLGHFSIYGVANIWAT